MKVYFAPLSCSLASRILIYELGLQAEFVSVHRLEKWMDGGADYREVYALGLVPALMTAEGKLITESAAVLQYLWRLAGKDALGDEDERIELQRWLSFIGAELHKTCFAPAFDPAAPQEAKGYGLAKAGARLPVVEAQLEGREFLLDRFTPADAYLYTVLNWARPAQVSLEGFPNLAAYHRRLYERPSVREAVASERPLYQAHQA